jgi:1-pyrroline-5-carboxylate dehydrogenase
MYIGDKEVRTGRKIALHPPHEIAHTLGYFHEGDENHVQQAIDAALQAKKGWEALSWENRAAIFLKAADLLATKYRPISTALPCWGKARMPTRLKSTAPANSSISSAGMSISSARSTGNNRQQPWCPQPHGMASAGRLRTGYYTVQFHGHRRQPARFCRPVRQCTVVWKPAYTQVFAAQLFMQVMKEAGLPAGVINLIYVDGPVLGKVCFSHRDFAGLHFTGSTAAFNHLYKTIGENIAHYRSYPRIVGETGGKDFVLAHESADPDVVATALLRGAFEYQGQKCSAASRAYIPANLAAAVKQRLIEGVKSFKDGNSGRLFQFHQCRDRRTKL